MSNVTVTGGQTFENSIINNVWVFGPGSEPERNQSPQMEELIAACPTASFLALDENTEVLDHVKNIINSKGLKMEMKYSLGCQIIIEKMKDTELD